MRLYRISKWVFDKETECGEWVVVGETLEDKAEAMVRDIGTRLVAKAECLSTASRMRAYPKRGFHKVLYGLKDQKDVL